MECLHVKNLEKYNPGYKDRPLRWCRLDFAALAEDFEFSKLDETDKWRFFAFTLLELKTQKHVPLDAEYLSQFGFDVKKRSISLTVQMLRKFVEIRNATDDESVTSLSCDTTPTVRNGTVRNGTERDEKVAVTKRNGSIPPNFDSVEDYFHQTLKHPDEAQKFYDYFTSNGWRVGRNPMKDWRAAARNWVRRSAPRPPSQRESSVDVRQQRERWARDAAPIPDEFKSLVGKIVKHVAVMP